ncbi:MAG: peptidoglycan editing factor PgeF [Spirochaetaceae bacterium]|nr:peptidoglycan editing factor PgeF [Spirochaetaceae bacterium]
MHNTAENPPLYRWKIFDPFSQAVNIGLTSRMGGYSSGVFSHFNQALHCGDIEQSVIKNRQLLCGTEKIPFSRYTCAQQTHSGNIHRILPEDIGAGRNEYLSSIRNTDALIITDRDIMINIHVADCVPIAVYDSEKKIGALIHAGWKGTAQLITLKTIRYMVESLNCHPLSLIAGIGPSIDSCCFEIGEETETIIKRSFHYSPEVISREKKTVRANLKRANLEQLTEAGIPLSNIEISGICTSCSNDNFYSYRADGGNTGRFAAFMILK